jgi:hypothetical protein
VGSMRSWKYSSGPSARLSAFSVPSPTPKLDVYSEYEHGLIGGWHSSSREPAHSR